MTAPRSPLASGSRHGCYTVMALFTDAPKAQHRVYQVQTSCCQRELTLTTRSLLTAGLAQTPACRFCLKRGTIYRRDKLVVGAVIGPWTIVGAEDLESVWRRVRWACCGREKTVTLTQIYALRQQIKRDGMHRCRACADHARSEGWRIPPAVLPPGILPAALAWPRPGVRP